MISEMLWSECDLCLVPELNLRIKIKLSLLDFLAFAMTCNAERLDPNY